MGPTFQVIGQLFRAIDETAMKNTGRSGQVLANVVVQEPSHPANGKSFVLLRWYTTLQTYLMWTQVMYMMVRWLCSPEATIQAEHSSCLRWVSRFPINQISTENFTSLGLPFTDNFN